MVIEKAVKSAQSLFCDVNEEYGSLPIITERFQEWRTRYPKIYDQAFGTESMAKICETFIRQELLVEWDTLLIENLQLENMKWFTTLLDFSEQIAASTNQSSTKNQDEINFLPNLIADIVLDKVKVMLTNFWDPYSKSQNLRAQEIIKQLKPFAEVPRISEKMKEVLMAVRITLQNAAENSILPLPVKSKNTGQVKEFCERQFWSLMKLFTIAASWCDYLTPEVFEDILFNCLLNTKILPYIKTIENPKDILEAAEKIQQALGKTRYRDTPIIPSLGFYRDFLQSLKKITSK